VYERYTTDARRAVVLAQEEARAFGHGSVAPEHLLLGVLGVEDGAAARALAGFGLTAERGRADVERITGRGSQAPHGSLPFTPRSRAVVEQALREAMSLGNDEVGTEHMVLALLGDRDGVAGRVLRAVAGPEVMRGAVLTALAEPPDEAPDVPPAGEGAAAVPSVRDLPATIGVRLGDDVRRLLRRAAGHALADDTAELTVEHVRRALASECP
jgi:ATP-dependent Clp protease ATP-binding subunit ClpC